MEFHVLMSWTLSHQQKINIQKYFSYSWRKRKSSNNTQIKLYYLTAYDFCSIYIGTIAESFSMPSRLRHYRMLLYFWLIAFQEFLIEFPIPICIENIAIFRKVDLIVFRIEIIYSFNHTLNGNLESKAQVYCIHKSNINIEQCPWSKLFILRTSKFQIHLAGNFLCPTARCILLAFIFRLPIYIINLYLVLIFIFNMCWERVDTIRSELLFFSNGYHAFTSSEVVIRPHLLKLPTLRNAF